MTDPLTAADIKPGDVLVNRKWDEAYVCRKVSVITKGKWAGEAYLIVRNAETNFQIQILECQLNQWDLQN